MLRLYDVRTGQVETVGGAYRGELRMCVCGPSVDRAVHVGDLRAYLVSDLIRRCSERHGRTVTVCQVIADLGFPAEPEVARRHEDAFRADLAALNIYPATHSPRASESVGLAIDMIAGLIEAGRAHQAADGTVFSGGGQALWRAAGGGWPSPWGSGVPGRDAACWAAALHYLGERIDVQVGGTDVEHERARYDAAAGHEAVRHWVRGERVLFGGREMAESVPLSELTGRGLDPLALRLAFLDRHYRRPANLDWDTLEAADKTLRRWRERVAGWARSPSAAMPRGYTDAVRSAFDDDLDTPAALRALRGLERDEAVQPGARFEAFAHLDQLLGLDLARDIGKPGPA